MCTELIIEYKGISILLSCFLFDGNKNSNRLRFNSPYWPDAIVA